MPSLCKKCGRVHADAATGMNLGRGQDNAPPPPPPSDSGFNGFMQFGQQQQQPQRDPSLVVEAPLRTPSLVVNAPPPGRRRPVEAPPAPRAMSASTLVPPSADSASGIWTVQILLSDTAPVRISGIVPATDKNMPMDSKLFVTGIYIKPGQYLFGKRSSPLHASSIALAKLKGDTVVPAGVQLSIEVKNSDKNPRNSRGQLFLVNVIGADGKTVAPLATSIVDLAAAPGFGSKNFRS